MQNNLLFGLKSTEKAIKRKSDNGPTDRQTDRKTDRPTDIVNYRVACTRLKKIPKRMKWKEERMKRLVLKRSQEKIRPVVMGIQPHLR